jgi:hypothetical protein
MSVSARIVSAIKNLGTRWSTENKALVLTNVGRLRAAGREVIAP